MSNKKLKKVLLISNRVMHYRVSVYNYFAENFPKEGWEFSLLANEIQHSNSYKLNFPCEIIPFSLSGYIKTISRLKPDAVILFLHLKDKLIWPLALWLKIKGIPIIYWTKGANLDDANNRFRHLFFRIMHTISDRLLLYSANEISFIDEFNRHKVFIANNAINHHDYPVIDESKEDIKNEFRITHEKLVLFVGRMGIDGDRKKSAHLIEIARRTKRKNIGFIFVGSGMPDKLIQSLNASNTYYLGEIQDPENIQISKLFKAADVFCIPGHVGLGLNQAFYWGLPIVTEEGLQPPEIHYLKDSENGFLVDEDDIDELERKILYLLDHDALRTKFSECAKHTIQTEGSIENMCKGFTDCLDSLK